MGKLLDKIKFFLLNKPKEYRHKRDFRRTAKRTHELKKAERSDVERWKDNKELLENWNERTFLIAGMVPDKAKVIEFGAGNMALKNYLPENCEYQGSDLFQRSPEMKLCDLNKGIDFNLDPYDTAVFSGVLEYVYDLDKVFEKLNLEINWIILSYACKDSFSENRERFGWLSDYNKEELIKIFQKYHYEIIESQEWKKQSIFKLKKNEFSQ